MTWEQGQDLADIGQEAHVEHPVRLVEDEDLHLRQVDVVLADMVQQATGRRDEDLDPAAQGLGLGLDRHAAVDDRRAQRHGPAVGLEALVHLHRELAGRDEDQRSDGMAGRREARVGVLPQAVQDGQREGRGLAGAGLGGGEEVASLEDEGDRFGLDGRRGRVALLGDGPDEIGREAEGIEGQVGS